MKKFLTFSVIALFFGLLFNSFITPDKDVVVIKNKVFEVEYSQKLKQPLMLKYESTNRPTNVNRGSMDFYSEPKIITSGPEDYKNNEWDKGHLAPAATFSDNMGNLKQTFSYLNCALQQQDLNRGEWRLLEEQERVWDDKEPLTIKIELLFDKDSKVLPSGATVPSYLVKHIHFNKIGVWKCYKFQNAKPTKKWLNHEIKCIKH
jgi:DNA/RNA endonuclease G (NUC1)